MIMLFHNRTKEILIFQIFLFSNLISLKRQVGFIQRIIYTSFEKLHQKKRYVDCITINIISTQITKVESDAPSPQHWAG